MEKYDIYKDVAKRTQGDVYIGVVGPVRTGKSTFVTRLMEKLVLPNISNKASKQIATDEMPQSADGKTIMTTEPKFMPANGVKITLKNKMTAKIRLIDCVGYLVDGAVGHQEDGKPRLVKTPWSEKEIPFEKAAEIGTEKVIKEHSTIGIVVTSDGTFGELERQAFISPEERAIKELKNIGKPFIIILNSNTPEAKESINLKNSLETKHGVPVMLLNVTKLEIDDINGIFEKILYEFPMQSINISLPKYLQTLPSDNKFIRLIANRVKEKSKEISKMKDYACFSNMFEEGEKLFNPVLTELKLGEGVAEYKIEASKDLFYEILSEECQDEINGEYELMSYVKSLSEAKREYAKVKEALKQAEEYGYGIVNPSVNEMTLLEPELIKKGGAYGVKLKANAPSLHIMKVEVEGEVNPIVGTEKQGQELVDYLMNEFRQEPHKIWDTNMFGKSLYELMQEGLNGKLKGVPEDAKEKMRKTLCKIVNEGDGGVICILL